MQPAYPVRARRLLPHVALIALLLAVLAGGLTPSPTALANPSEAEALAQRVIELTNAERAALGLPPLRRQDNLQTAAMWIAQDSADYNYLSHTDRLGRGIVQRFGDFGYSGYSWIAENLAAGYTTPESVVAGWMASQGHRENILSASACEIGAGYGFSAASTYRHYWAQTFGCRRGTHPVVINGEAAQTSSATVGLYIYGAGWAQELRLSNDGVAWTAWEPFQSTRQWSLTPGSGVRTVYVELRSGATVRASNDSILLIGQTDPSTATATVPPTVTATATSTDAPTATPTATPTAVGPGTDLGATATPTGTATAGATPAPAGQRAVFLPVVRKAPPPPTATPTSLPSSPTPTTGGTLPGGWLERVNAYRALAGVPPVSEDATLSANCREHARYMAENGHLTHDQDRNLPWASDAGQACAQSGNAFLGGGTWQAADAIDSWIGSVGHRLWLLYPTTPSFGFGIHSNGQRTGAALDVLSRSRLAQDRAYTGWPVRYPGTGQRGVPARALPITLQWPYFDEAPTLLATSLRTAGGAILEHTATTELPVGHKGIAITPARPLPAGTTIEVTVEGRYKGQTFRFTWTFTTA